MSAAQNAPSSSAGAGAADEPRWAEAARRRYLWEGKLPAARVHGCARVRHLGKRWRSSRLRFAEPGTECANRAGTRSCLQRVSSMRPGSRPIRRRFHGGRLVSVGQRRRSDGRGASHGLPQRLRAGYCQSVQAAGDARFRTPIRALPTPQLPWSSCARRWLTPVLYAPLIVSVGAFSWLSPLLPTDGSIPA